MVVVEKKRKRYSSDLIDQEWSSKPSRTPNHTLINSQTDIKKYQPRVLRPTYTGHEKGKSYARTGWPSIPKNRWRSFFAVALAHYAFLAFFLLIVLAVMIASVLIDRERAVMTIIQ